LYRTTIIFSLKDRAGVLCDALKPFKKYKISLTSITSRPHILKEWQYVFFIEIKGSFQNPRVKKALREFKKYTTDIDILGSYALVKL